MLDRDRDDNGRVGRIVSDGSNDMITGPLGIWPFPLLNLLMQNAQSGSSVTVTEIHRDEDGRIQTIEEFEK